MIIKYKALTENISTLEKEKLVLEQKMNEYVLEVSSLKSAVEEHEARGEKLIIDSRETIQNQMVF